MGGTEYFFENRDLKTKVFEYFQQFAKTVKTPKYRILFDYHIPVVSSALKICIIVNNKNLILKKKTLRENTQGDECI